MDLWWTCPNCGRKVNFTKEMQSECFDENGEAEFDPEYGIMFHTLFCECGASCVMSMSGVEPKKIEKKK